MSEFDDHLKAIPPSQQRWKDAVIDACDSAFMARAWLRAHAPHYTPADVVALAALIVHSHKTRAEGDGSDG